MKVYGLSGLGADHRVFQYLEIGEEIKVIPWLPPEKKETIQKYATRISKRIDTEEEFILIGVSFGGVIAVEVAQIIKPKLTILISSLETSNHLSRFQKWVGTLNIIRFIPIPFLKPPIFIARYFFGTKHELLPEIINDTDLNFVKWALQALLSWKCLTVLDSMYNIHGNKDRLLPIHRSERTIEIKGGGHFMIVDRAAEISKAILTLREGQRI